MTDTDGTILALDVGAARIGLALASRVARLASPYRTIAMSPSAIAELHTISVQERVTQLVIGLPRGMQGQDTPQTIAVQEFAKQVTATLQLPVAWQDEAVTSVRAEAELKARGKPYEKGDIDALAATYILEDYLHENL